MARKKKQEYMARLGEILAAKLPKVERDYAARLIQASLCHVSSSRVNRPSMTLLSKCNLLGVIST